MSVWLPWRESIPPLLPTLHFPLHVNKLVEYNLGISFLLKMKHFQIASICAYSRSSTPVINFIRGHYKTRKNYKTKLPRAPEKTLDKLDMLDMREKVSNVTKCSLKLYTLSHPWPWTTVWILPEDNSHNHMLLLMSSIWCCLNVRETPSSRTYFLCI